ncbi:MAG: methyltransferase domain-containing protein [Candidatus Pristimantibacillus sp.]
MERLQKKEWLDEEDVELAELEHSLGEVWNVNRYLGGNPALFSHLNKLVRRMGAVDCIKVLDVATGLADIPLALLSWCEKRGIKVTIVGVDTHSKIVELAMKNTSNHSAIQVLKADGTQLPFDNNSFDIVFSNLALHHMDEDAAVKLVSEMDRVSRAGWVITDLERHKYAYLAAKLLAKFVWRSPVTKHDGPLSVQRSFTASEARSLVERAGVQASVHRHFPFRLALVRYV